jgi:hypothetical protein
MSWKVQVTKKNVEKMATIASALRSHLRDLLSQVREYPLEVHFDGYCLFFDKEPDVISFIDWLDEQVKAVRAAA